MGGHVLRLLIGDPRIGRIVAPVRRPLPEAGKLVAPVVDFAALPETAEWWAVDAVICAFGTTIRKAGSRQAFRSIDCDGPLAVARLARQRGATALALTSALGANAGSRFFYNRVKGELEQDIEALGFPSLTLVRPGLIGGERQEHRLVERFASRVLGTLGPVLPRALRINPAERIAEALVEAAVIGRPGRHVVTSGAMV